MEIAEISEDDFQQVIDALAHYLISQHGAPHIAAALPMATDEAHYANDICQHPLHTLLAIEREFGDNGIVESLKVIRRQPGDNHARIKLWGTS